MSESMTEHALAILSAVVAWWLSTAVILRVVWLPRETHRVSLAVFSGLGIAAIYGVVWSSEVPTVGGAYVGFGSALAIWAWHELTFLLGKISGPRRIPCWPEASGWARFRDATATVIYHELALALTVVGLVATTWGSPNQVATWTFLVLWVMRLSAKLNVFFGVRNLSEDFIPPHLRYLSSYFGSARWSPGVLVSLVGASVALIPLVSGAISDGGGFAVHGHTLVSTMLGLGMLEHLFLALPLPDAMLWRWIIPTDPSKRSWSNPWFTLGMIDQWIPK